MYNSWLNYLIDGNENNITNEVNKKLYEQLIKDGKDNATNIKILGFIVEGTKEEFIAKFLGKTKCFERSNLFSATCN